MRVTIQNIGPTTATMVWEVSDKYLAARGMGCNHDSATGVARMHARRLQTTLYEREPVVSVTLTREETAVLDDITTNADKVFSVEEIRERLSRIPVKFIPKRKGA